MMLRLIASVSPRLSVSHARRGLPLAGRGLPLAARITPPAPPVDTLKGAIRLNFAAWRLSLPFSERSHGHHERKTA
ncbi:hypothetical protein LGH82_17440 [Mesorhizobium sp. PAMC28654]|uniref:hypothetical protein n=1 Tax=Mesorhizobium sp. PAMC28654 TaxID=2880934 RepID=UPI001D0AD7FE|nr:hypothetical protein [Mesorhizobium sp. PAMC28654]UDL87003.1 hypothetical protein LGH82_17440 [Mesorhizobium sp. PAMC28654]